MKCSGEQDTTRNIPRSITLSPLHFMSYRGKFISFGTVYSTAVSWGLVSIPIWRQCPSKIPLQDLHSEGAILKNRGSLADRQKCKTSTQTTVYMDCINNSYDKTPHTVLVTLSNMESVTKEVTSTHDLLYCKKLGRHLEKSDSSLAEDDQKM